MSKSPYRLLQKQNRAVSIQDYANLALGVSEVGKTNAIAETRQSVTIFVGYCVRDRVSTNCGNGEYTIVWFSY